jgi:hypothetical protein
MKSCNDEKGHYVDGIGTDHGAVHSNMMVLAFDIVPESRKKAVVDYIKTSGMGCSVYGAQFLMEAIYNAGAADYALELMTATHDRSWYNMIKIGSTIPSKPGICATNPIPTGTTPGALLPVISYHAISGAYNQKHPVSGL